MAINMPDVDSIKTQNSGGVDDEPGSIWRKIKSFFSRDQESSLREQIEDAITEHEQEENDSDDDAPNGDLLPVERIMLRNLLKFSDHDVDDIMVPRSKMIAVEENSNFDECVALFSEHGHSRLPVYRENLDNIIGMIHIKDFFSMVIDDSHGTTADTNTMLPDGLEPFLRQPRFVPESMGVLDLLAEMRATRTHLAIILDEYSGTEGLVTIEDLVEQIVGDIEDEHDEDPTEDYIKIAPGIWEADAGAELEDVAEEIDANLAIVEDDVQTLGGLAFVLAGKVPSVGETVHHPASGWDLEVLEGDDKRVVKFRLHEPDQHNPIQDKAKNK